MSEYLTRSYADVYSICQSASLRTLLDPENGFAPRLKQLCSHQYVYTLFLEQLSYFM